MIRGGPLTSEMDYLAQNMGFLPPCLVTHQGIVVMTKIQYQEAQARGGPSQRAGGGAPCLSKAHLRKVPIANTHTQLSIRLSIIAQDSSTGSKRVHSE